MRQLLGWFAQERVDDAADELDATEELDGDAEHVTLTGGSTLLGKEQAVFTKVQFCCIWPSTHPFPNGAHCQADASHFGTGAELADEELGERNMLDELGEDEWAGAQTKPKVF